MMRMRKPATEKIAVALKSGEFDDMTYREIADDLNVPHRSVVRTARKIGDGLPNRNFHIGERKSGATSLYFIQEGARGPIKIGVSSDVGRRFYSLQVGNPRRLHLLGTVLCCGNQLELDIHRRFSQLRIRGEWFRPSPELLAFITSCLSVPEEQLALLLLGGEQGCSIWTISPAMSS